MASKVDIKGKTKENQNENKIPEKLPRVSEPAVLFDTFLGRDPQNFQESPGGSSSLLFHHASIIKLDLEYCEKANLPLELNLAPLYGIGKDQDEVRTKSGGAIINDVFHSKQAVMYPPAVVCLLLCYNRYHNYIVNVLSKINENGRFKGEKASNFDDEELFKTARGIVIRIYRNITLADWLPSLAAANGLEGPYRLEDLAAYKTDDLPPKGRVSQLFSFDSCISQADETWYRDFLAKQVLYKEMKDPKKAKGNSVREKLSSIEPEDYQKAIERYEKSIWSPNWRGFNGWKRKMGLLSKTWAYDDKNLVDVLKSAIEEPAGAFVKNNIPRILRPQTVSRIQATREKNIPKLAAFHQLYKYKPLTAMTDINTKNMFTAIDLAKCYTRVEDVDILPGLYLDEPQIDVKLWSGTAKVTPLYHAIVSYTVKLALKDSGNFTPSKLTKWGYNESAMDLDIFDGSMCYKLIQRALPNWFPYNSLYVMQPMFTVSQNIAQATSDGTIRLFNTSYDRRDVDLNGKNLVNGEPSDPGAKQAWPILLHGWAKTVLKDQDNFHVPWAQKFNAMQPGIQTFDNYMLAGDKPQNYKQKDTIQDEMNPAPTTSDILQDFVVTKAQELIAKHSEKVGNVMQIDIIRDVAIPAQTYLLADLFLLNVECDWNPEGEFSAMTLYKILLTVRIWGFTDFDFTKSWKRRNDAGKGVEALQTSTLKVVEGILSDKIKKPEKKTVREIGTKMVLALDKAGWTAQAIADVLWLTAVGSIGVVAGAFADSLTYLLKREKSFLQRETDWETVQKAAAKATNNKKDEASNKKIRQYFLESIRLCSWQGLLRNVVKDNWVVASAAPPYLPIPIPYKYKAGQVVPLALGPACRIFPSWGFWFPWAFWPGWNEDEYIIWGHSQHQCIGKEFCIVFGTAMFKAVAQLKGVGLTKEGLKKVNLGVTQNYFLNEDEGDLLFDPMTFKLKYDL